MVPSIFGEKICLMNSGTIRLIWTGCCRVGRDPLYGKQQEPYEDRRAARPRARMSWMSTCRASRRMRSMWS